MALYVWVYIYMREKFLHEVNYVLKKMGKLCLIERNKSSPWHIFLRYSGIFKSAIGEYDNFLTVHEVKNLLPKNGFEIISITGDYFIFPFVINITGDYFIFPFGLKQLFVKKIGKKIARLIPAFSYNLIVNARKQNNFGDITVKE